MKSDVFLFCHPTLPPSTTTLLLLSTLVQRAPSFSSLLLSTSQPQFPFHRPPRSSSAPDCSTRSPSRCLLLPRSTSTMTRPRVPSLCLVLVLVCAVLVMRLGVSEAQLPPSPTAPLPSTPAPFIPEKGQQPLTQHVASTSPPSLTPPPRPVSGVGSVFHVGVVAKSSSSPLFGVGDPFTFAVDGQYVDNITVIMGHSYALQGEQLAPEYAMSASFLVHTFRGRFLPPPPLSRLPFVTVVLLLLRYISDSFVGAGAGPLSPSVADSDVLVWHVALTSVSEENSSTANPAPLTTRGPASMLVLSSVRPTYSPTCLCNEPPPSSPPPHL